MHEDILDHIEELDLIDDRFYYKKSKKHLKNAALLIVGAIILINIAQRLSFLATITPIIGVLLLVATVVMSSIGLVNGIKSYLKKERHAADRFLILLGNLIISGVFILLLVANVLDLMRFYN